MTRKIAIIFSLALGLSVPAGAWAQRLDFQPPGRSGDPKAQPAPQPQPKPNTPVRLVPIAEVEAQLNRIAPGRKIDATTTQTSNGPVYQIIWDAGGRRIDFTVDAQTGRIIDRRG